MNRRQFMKQSAGALATAVAAPALLASGSAAAAPAVQLRTLGKTGITTSLLGMGTGTTSWNKDSAQIRKGEDVFIDTLVHAYDRGLRYFDLADMYGSHPYMQKAMERGKMDRSKLMILTKTVSKDAAAVKADIERFRQEIGTDYVDVVLLHCMTAGTWAEELKPCMDVLAEAKAKGQIKAHGVSCHNLDAMKTAASHPWVDIMLNRINPFGVKMDGTVDEVVEVLRTGHKNGKGMLGMKICGEGQYASRMTESVKFVVGLGCIDSMNIGFLDSSEVDGAIDNFKTALA